MATLTYANIETRVMNQLRLPTSNSTEATKVAALVNEVYRDIAAKEDWWWLTKRQIINTVNDLDTGTLSVTQGSTTITFSSAPSSSVAGRVLLVPSNTVDSNAVWRIATHTASSATATLDAAYTGGTNTAAGYHVYQDTYDLATDVSKLLYVKRFGYTRPLELIGPHDMADMKLTDTSVGKPHWATVHEFETTGDPTTQKQFIVHPYPDETYRLELFYKQTLNTELSSTTRPLIPDDYAQVLIYGSLARGYPIFLNDTERGVFFQNLFNDILTLMVSAQRERASDRPQMTPRDSYRAHYRTERRGVPTTLGSYFDRWPSVP